MATQSSPSAAELNSDSKRNGAQSIETLYASASYKMACDQFDQAADFLEITTQVRERTKRPKRSMVVCIPIHLDSGEAAIFMGFRVQHHLTLGPTKGGLRYHPEVSLGEVAALAMWMSWKCALVGLPYGVCGTVREFLAPLRGSTEPRCFCVYPSEILPERSARRAVDSLCFFSGLRRPSVGRGRTEPRRRPDHQARHLRPRGRFGRKVWA